MYRKAVPSHRTRSNGQGAFQRKEDKNGTHIYDTKREHCTISCHVHAQGNGLSQGLEGTI
jgi:hypothetical protein